MKSRATRVNEASSVAEPAAKWDGTDVREEEERDEERRRETQKKNLDAFLKMLPDLLKNDRSKYALIVNGKLERIGADLEPLLDYAYSKFPGVPGLIQPIQDKLPKVHLGSPKLLAP